ncbi:unnamed protein product [Fusarium fujikuroi]|nr:unnamed protein product [Fusarium fujikuroi]
MGVGFVNDPQAVKNSSCHWSQILVPGELKSNLSADKASEAWLDLGRYAREVLAAQDALRFVLGFTICGSLMRAWFDINDDGFRFVFTILGFLWMDEEELGFDPTIVSANQERFIKINRNGSTERIIIDQIRGMDDDIKSNARRGLDINSAANFRPPCPAPRNSIASGVSREGRSSTRLNRKRSYSQSGAHLPSSKRSCSVSLTKATSTLPNRVHRRVILRDYGMPIYKASSRSASLAAFERYIQGHESLYKAGFLQRHLSQ